MKDSSLQAFDQYTKLHDWSPVNNATDVNSKVNTFIQLTVGMMKTFFPLKTVKIHENDKPFITGRIKQHIMSKRDKLYQRGSIDKFKSLRKQIAFEIRKEKRKILQQHKFYNGLLSES